MLEEAQEKPSYHLVLCRDRLCSLNNVIFCTASGSEMDGTESGIEEQFHILNYDLYASLVLCTMLTIEVDGVNIIEIVTSKEQFTL